MNNYKKLFEDLLSKERRAGDEELVMSPKGVSHASWVLANNLAMAIRMATPKGDVSEDYSDKELLRSLLVMFVDITPVQIFEEMFGRVSPEIADKLVNLFDRFRGMGFGPTLRGVVMEINKITKK